MRAKLLALVLAVALLGGGGTALAHVHPMVPADECAPASTDGNPNVGAGNESSGISEHTDWHPENEGSSLPPIRAAPIR